jgi:uncharacterized protein (DUF924 family)
LNHDTIPECMLAFWFGLDRPGKKDDGAVRNVMGGPYEAAAAHQLDRWIEAPRDRLALILLLDQAPRHLYRADARAYATDLKAQTVAERYFQAEDWDLLSPRETYFAVLPWLHSEQASHQARVNPVIWRLAPSLPALSYMGEMADLYQETILRFGRFPHRARRFGVPNSTQELRFLDEVWGPRRLALRARAGKGADGY